MTYAPLPGTEPPVRGLFVDRWGTLLDAPAGARMGSFEASWVCPGAADALFRAVQEGWRVYLIGNEEEVAFGRASREEWERLERDLLAFLAGRGVRVTRNYACLDHPEGKAPHRRRSVFQLPDTGLLYHAQQADGLTLAECWVIGDGSEEMAAGARAGCRLARLRRPEPRNDLHVEPDLWAADLARAITQVIAVKVYARPRGGVRAR